MKHIITITSLLAAGTLCASAAVESGSYTLNMNQWTLNDYTLYNYLYGAINEGGTLTFDLDINYTGTNCNAYQTLIHVGEKDTGMSIMANGGPHLIVGQKNLTDVSHELTTANLNTGTNDVLVVITGKTAGTASVSITLNGTEYRDCVATWTWADMAWNTSGGENAKYSINCGAPGWGTLNAAQTTTLTSAVATFVAIPEPSAFGLLAGLGALALAGTRRRRRK